MAYKALYRTYRPQTFEEVAGQKHIIRTLKNALATNKIAHAYLFCGPRGTGKTTMAKLFAKALNCEHGVGCQCNECSNCQEIIDGSHPDVIEIDAASNNGVEQVRDIIEVVNYLPMKGRYKIYIIDEAHMMTSQAFNALLKTIEEPPAHVIFIFATTEPHAILPTVLSRCQRYDFTKVNDADIEERMMTILEKEGVEYDKDAVRAIISLADGGMRDALSILDQILAYSNNTLSVQDVYQIFGLISIKEKVDLIKDVANGSVSRTLERIDSFAKGGIDFKRLTQDILEILKDVLIYKKTDDTSELTTLNEKTAMDLSDSIDIKKVHTMIGAFLKLQNDFKTANNIKTLLEITLLKLLTLDDVEPSVVVQPKIAPQPAPIVKPIVESVPEQKVQPIIQEEIQKPVETPVVEKTIEIQPKEPAKPQPIVEEKTKTEIPAFLLENDGDKKEILDEGEKYLLEDKTMINCMVIGSKELRLSISQRWDELSGYFGHPVYGDLVALLKDGTPYIVTNNVIILVYDFEKLASRVNIKQNSNQISKIIEKMFGRDMFVYAISRSESVRLYTKYQNLRQITSLPSPKSIHIELEDLRK